MHNELYERIRRFVAHHSGCALHRIDADTTLLADLNLDGDDAWEFFEDFAKMFKVDLGNLDLTKHFHTEWDLLAGPLDIAWLLWETLRGRARFDPDTTGLKPIRVHDLVLAAVQRKWPGA